MKEPERLTEPLVPPCFYVIYAAWTTTHVSFLFLSFIYAFFKFLLILHEKLLFSIFWASQIGIDASSFVATFVMDRARDEGEDDFIYIQMYMGSLSAQFSIFASSYYLLFLFFFFMLDD